MSKLLIPLSVSLIAALSLTTPAKAELSTDNLMVNANLLCSQSVNQLSSSNNSSPQNILLAEVILERVGEYQRD
jgi:pyrroline-5-carboxylate reductase